MHISVRQAHNDDIPRLVSLYDELETEQTDRKPIWALMDGLDHRSDLSLVHALEQDDSWVLAGEIEEVVVGFVWMTVEQMLNRAQGSRMGRIRLIYTEPDARGVGVGHAMLEAALERFRELGIEHFDAPVGPGQRAAKNFFEGHGFAARSIIMYHTDVSVTDA
ncbi:MAG: hypothetical protein BMS9Abin12_1952 [Acidimicrobiia bacterium]|nr:MAG: hypothetical protein BMS9Abin12_1952 [Acidimicrobiia bacterium]